MSSDSVVTAYGESATPRSVVEVAEAIVTAELEAGTEWAGDREIACQVCGCEFLPPDFVAHLRDPKDGHAAAAALDLIAALVRRRSGDRISEAALQWVADVSGLDLDMVEEFTEEAQASLQDWG